MTTKVTQPDLSSRPFHVLAERVMKASPDALFQAWTDQFDVWFAASGSVIMEATVNNAFDFRTLNTSKVLKYSANVQICTFAK
jgi:uncharacterized protein YndB with AHSA1/START domain